MLRPSPTTNGPKMRPATTLPDPPGSVHDAAAGPLPATPFARLRQLDEVEALAGMGSFGVDLLSGRWMGSPGLDAVLGIGAGFTRSFRAGRGLVHPADWASVVGHLGGDVLDRRAGFDLAFRIIRADNGQTRWVHVRGRLEPDAYGRPAHLVGTVTDITERQERDDACRRLEQAVAQTSDAIVLIDLEGSVEYVNAAFERLTGFQAAEVLGKPVRALRGGTQTAGFYRALWRRLRRGETWSGTIVNRHKDGSLIESEATISPIRGPADEIMGYVSVKRDVTLVRATESSLAREFRERTEVAAALARLRPGPNAELTAAEIRDELLALPGIDVALVIEFQDRRRAVPLAVGAPDGFPHVAGEPLPAIQAFYLAERAAQGPWAEASMPGSGEIRDVRRLVAPGVRAFAFAPIRTDHGLLGVIAAGTCDEGYARHLIDHLPAVGEFAETAGALLRGPLERDRRTGLVRSRVRTALAVDGLHPVFQPIVALATRRPVGYEALTRFADGAAPDQLIVDAHASGLGPDLELACLRAALDAAEALDPACWLSVNVSPSVIVETTELAAVLRGHGRRIVLEVTEHVEIADYQAVRRAVARFGPNVCLAVDDAGAGFASLRHVVELVPRFLKLDLSLVRRVDRDLARQAMIAGLRQFADRASCQVIAEGIEEPAELEMLRRLGVELGQGYLLGRAEPLSSTSGASKPEVTRRRSARAGRRPPAKAAQPGTLASAAANARNVASSRPVPVAWYEGATPGET